MAAEAPKTPVRQEPWNGRANYWVSPVMELSRTTLLPPFASFGAAMLWVVLAWRSPTLTHHFAPFIAALAWGFLARRSTTETLTDTDHTQHRALTLQAFVGGLGIAIGATVVLLASNKLLGPGLYGSLPVTAELLIHGLAGAVVGARPWTLARNPPS